MSEPIKPNATAAFYNTIIPSLTDDADIQEALRMYHYGTTDGSIPDDGANPIAAESIAAYLGDLQSQITGIGIGSEYSSTAPTLTNDDNGYIWVDSTSAPLIFNDGVPTIAFYQSAAPTTGLVAGMLWVDSDDDSVYVYSGTSWDPIASGGSSYTPGAYSETSMTGLGIDVSALSGTPFVFNGTTPFGAGLVITGGRTKNAVTLSVGSAVSSSGVGQIVLQRVINNDPSTATAVAAFAYSNGNMQFSYVDSHGASNGTLVSYGLTNATTDAVTFSSANGSAIQISVQEVG
jgi:hypothetical protein